MPLAEGDSDSDAASNSEELRDVVRYVYFSNGGALGTIDPGLCAPDGDEGACRWCDYRVVCGPYEELRTKRKWQPKLRPLFELRGLS